MEFDSSVSKEISCGKDAHPLVIILKNRDLIFEQGVRWGEKIIVPDATPAQLEEIIKTLQTFKTLLED